MSKRPASIVEEYSCGKCVYLALALNRLYGLRILAQMESIQGDECVAHAYCQMDNGKEVDIMGVQEKVDCFSESVRRFAPDELLEFISHGVNSEREKAEALVSQAMTVVSKYLADEIEKELS